MEKLRICQEAKLNICSTDSFLILFLPVSLSQGAMLCVCVPALVPGCQWLGSTSQWESPSFPHSPVLGGRTN